MTLTASLTAIPLAAKGMTLSYSKLLENIANYILSEKLSRTAVKV